MRSIFGAIANTPPSQDESSFPVFSAQELPPAVIERIADRFRLLSDPSRLRLVNALHVDGELSVGELVERAGVTYGAVSKQLALLRSHGVLARRREGTRIYYRIHDPSMSDLCDAVCKGIRDDWARWGAALEQDLNR